MPGPAPDRALQAAAGRLGMDFAAVCLTDRREPVGVQNPALEQVELTVKLEAVRTKEGARQVGTGKLGCREGALKRQVVQGQNGSEGQGFFPDQHGQQGGLPIVHMQDFWRGRHASGQFKNGFGEENKPLGVVRIIAVVGSVEAGAVKIFVPADQEELEAGRGLALDNLGIEAFVADGDRDPDAGGAESEFLGFPEAAVSGEHQADLVSAGGEGCRECVQEVPKTACPRKRGQFTAGKDNFHSAVRLASVGRCAEAKSAAGGERRGRICSFQLEAEGYIEPPRHGNSAERMTLGNLLSVDQIIPEMKAMERWSAIVELVDLLVERGQIKAQDRDVVLAALRQREETMSTGIGFGIAIPHASSDRVGQVVAAFGRSTKGIEFDSLDNSPVRFIVLFVVPKDQFQTHLRTLAAIAKFLNDRTVRERLAQATSTGEIMAIFENNAQPKA